MAWRIWRRFRSCLSAVLLLAGPARAAAVDDIAGVPPVACYGTIKLRAAYHGPLLRVVSPATQVATNLYPGPDGRLDRRALIRAMGSASLVQVAVLYDQCGGHDAAAPDAASRPDISPAVAMGSGIGVALDGTTNLHVAKRLLLPDTLALPAGAASSQVAVVSFRAWFGENAGISVLWNAADARADSTSWGYAGSSAYYVALTAHRLLALRAPGSEFSPAAPLTPFVTGYVSGADGTRLWMGGRQAMAAASYRPAVRGGAIGALSFLPTYGYLDIAELLIYARALSPAEQRRATAASDRAFGLQPGLTDTIEVLGDSIGEGQGSVLNLSWPRQMFSRLRRPWIVANASVSGRTAIGMAPLLDADFFRRAFPAAGGRRVVIVDFGSNDIYHHATAAAAYDALRRIVMAAHAAGATVIIATILPRSDYDAAQEAERQALNRQLRTARAGADALVDFAGDPMMQTNPQDPQNYTDGIHPTTAGYARLAALAARAVNGLRPATSPHG
jgi:lysophospholipase L1-like esterase